MTYSEGALRRQREDKFMFFVGQKIKVAEFEDIPETTGEVVAVGDDCVAVQLEIDGESTYAEFYQEDGMWELVRGA